MSLYTQQMKIYNDIVTAYDKEYNKAKSLYDDYIRRRNGYNTNITQFTQLISATQTRINNYNNAVAAYKVALDDYNRLNDDNVHLNFRLKDLFIKLYEYRDDIVCFEPWMSLYRFRGKKNR